MKRTYEAGQVKKDNTTNRDGQYNKKKSVKIDQPLNTGGELCFSQSWQASPIPSMAPMQLIMLRTRWTGLDCDYDKRSIFMVNCDTDLDIS